MKIKVGCSYGIGSVRDVAITASGTHVVTVGGMGVFIWDRATGQRLRTLSSESGKVVAISRDAKLVAVGDGDTRVRILDFADGTLRGEYREHGLGGVASLAFAADGRYLASGGALDQRAIVWDIARAAIVSRLALDGDHATIAFSPDATRVITGVASGAVQLWDATAGTLLATFASEQLTGRIHDVGFSSDGKIAYAGSDAAICGWSTSSHQATELVATGSWSTAHSYAGTWLVCEVVNDPPSLCRGAPHRLGIVPTTNAIGFFSHVACNDQYAVTLDTEAQRILVWDLSRGVIESELVEHIAPQALISDGHDNLTAISESTLITWSNDGALKRITRVEPRSFYHLPHRGVAPVRVTIEEKSYSIASEKLLWRSAGAWQGGFASALDPQQQIFAAAPAELEGAIVLVDIASATVLRKLGGPGHLQAPFALAFSDDGALLASTGDDQSTRVWRISDGKQLHVFRDHKSAGFSVAWHPAGTLVAAGCNDGRVYVWDTQTAKLATTLKATGTVRSLAWSASLPVSASALVTAWGDVLAAADDMSVTIWDTTRAKRLAGVKASAFFLCFDAHGRLLCSDPSTGAVLSLTMT